MQRQRNNENSAGWLAGSGFEGGVEIWRSRDFDSIELHRGTGINQDFPRHWHDELYLCAILNGTGYVQSPAGNFSTPPGALVMLPAGEVHANRKMGCTFRCIFIGLKAVQNAVEKFIERRVSGLNFRTGLIKDARTMAGFLRMHRSFDESRSGIGREHALFDFLQKLVARHSAAFLALPRDGNEDAEVRRSKQFLAEHYAERVTLDELARLTGLSPYHLNRSFCRKIGMPPHAYQLHVRVSRAKSALETGSSIARVAMATGFADQSHFTRHFKRLAGVTPARYWRHRKNVQDSPNDPN
jgi:AraC-like DNA-binding protein